MNAMIQHTGLLSKAREFSHVDGAVFQDLLAVKREEGRKVNFVMMEATLVRNFSLCCFHIYLVIWLL